MSEVSVCFVCLGNICRSPTAEGVMRALVEEAGLGDAITIDSAGTGAYHAGERADARARATAKQRGLTLTSIARQFAAEDFERFDYVVAMDGSNFDNLRRLTRDDGQRARLSLLRNHDPQTAGRDLGVPDPYYEDNFDEVFDICDASCRALLTLIRQTHGL